MFHVKHFGLVNGLVNVRLNRIVNGSVFKIIIRIAFGRDIDNFIQIRDPTWI